MKNRLYLIVAAICMSFSSIAQTASYDLVIVGGNPGGIMAAIAAARLGKNAVILERSTHLGGLPANGLGATDIATRGATTGLFAEFTTRVRTYYEVEYGIDSPQIKACSDGFHFESSVASVIFENMLADYKGKITVLTMRQFNFEKEDIEMQDDCIKSIRVQNRNNGNMEIYTGKVFIDATYEGDLGAAAGVPFRVGRESSEEFGELGAGHTYEYWKSLPAEGSTGQADNALQAYNYRLCLTNNPMLRINFSKPENYNREEFISLIEDVWTGRNTQKIMREVTKEMMEENRKWIAAGNKTRLPGDGWGIWKLVTLNTLPNDKTDANNQHTAFISTDLPEENWAWPTSSWEWRDKFAKRLRDYTLGLFWFAQHDKELPAHFRKAVQQWGLADGEYEDNGYFPRQVYVREGRRFEGVYFFTASDALPVSPGKRPPLHQTSITASHYALDSHAARKREKGRAHLDGFISYPTAVYTVPFGVILPQNVDNLLLPVPVSGSHIGFSTLRMEPCWMALGQAAGVTAALAIDNRCKVRNVNVNDLQEQLVKEKATLIYYLDVTTSDPDFELVQYLGLRGYLPDWRANLQEPVEEPTWQLWQKLCGEQLNVHLGVTKRVDVLRRIYAKLHK